MNKLLQIKVLDQTTGKVYRLLGFRTTGDDRGGIYMKGFTLHDVEGRKVVVVNNVQEMKKYSVVIE